jgi:thiol-disulfide isomerase/thioredoxin
MLCPFLLMKRLPFTSVFCLSVLLVGAGCNPAEKEPPIPKVGGTGAHAASAGTLATMPKLGPAPAWKLKDLDGREVSSESLKGKVVVIDFWATWCGPCRVEIPGYVEMQKKYGQEGFAIVGISLDQAGPAVVKAFADKFAINYLLVMGDDAVTQIFGGVEAIPTTFLIDRTGQIRDRKLGAEHSETYEQKVLAVLREG